MSDFVYVNVGDNYERITHMGGVKTTICKNRFEVMCSDRAEINEHAIFTELKKWIGKRREEEVRDAGDLSEALS